LAETTMAPKILAPVKVQPQPSLSDEDKLDHLYTLYLQRTLQFAYSNEKMEFVNNMQAELSTVGIIDEFVTSDKKGLEIIASEKVCSSINDLAKIEEINAALDVLHPFVMHKETISHVQNMENSLSSVLDVIPANIPIQTPLEFSELQDSVKTLESIVNANNLFSFNLDMETLKSEVADDLILTTGCAEKKTTIKSKLSKVTSLKICDSYSTHVDASSKETTIVENPPQYQSTPFPS